MTGVTETATAVSNGEAQPLNDVNATADLIPDDLQLVLAGHK